MSLKREIRNYPNKKKEHTKGKKKYICMILICVYVYNHIHIYVYTYIHIYVKYFRLSQLEVIQSERILRSG